MVRRKGGTEQKMKSNLAERRRQALRDFMEERNLNALQWANKAGLRGPGSIYNFLKGRSNSLAQDTLEKLAAAAHASIDEILGIRSGSTQDKLDAAVANLDAARRALPDGHPRKEMAEPPQPGFASDEIESFSPPNAVALMAALYPGRPRAQWMRINTNALDERGILPEDTVIVDPDINPQPGDPVVVVLYDKTLQTEHLKVRIYYPGVLQPASLSDGHASIAIVADDRIQLGLAGVIVAVFRRLA